jgi:putative transposase
MSIVDESRDGVKCGEFSEVVRIDEGKVRQHVEEVVRSSVEATLNGLLEAEADELCGAKRYERSVERRRAR